VATKNSRQPFNSVVRYVNALCARNRFNVAAGRFSAAIRHRAAGGYLQTSLQ